MNRDLPDAKTASETARYDEDDAYDQFFRKAPAQPAQRQPEPAPKPSDQFDNVDGDFQPLKTEGLDYEVKQFRDHQWTENDRAELENFFAYASSHGVDQKGVDAALAYYVNAMAGVPQTEQRKANRPPSARSDSDRRAEIERVMRTDFQRYKRLGLDREYAKLIAKQTEGDDDE